MPYIQQQDITNGSIALTKLGNFTITTTSTYLQGNVSATVYTLGLSTAFVSTDPLQIKEGLSNSSVTGWSEEQDITLYNVSCTTVIPFYNPGAAVGTTAATTLTTGDLVGIYGAGSWSAGPTLSISRQLTSGAGSQNAGMIAGGLSNIGAYLSTFELLNGSSWFLGSGMVNGRQYLGATGAQNSTLAMGGENGTVMAASEMFNGTAWAATTNLTLSKYDAGQAGSAQAAVSFGGWNGSNNLSKSELFNGSSWAASNLMTGGQSGMGAFGSQMSAVGTGGYFATLLSTTQIFNGSAWAVTGFLSAQKQDLRGMGTGNAGMVTGGRLTGNVVQNITELFNGTVWCFSGNLVASKQQMGTGGSQGGGFSGAGYTTVAQRTSELHNQTLYRKLTYTNFTEAKNIGIATDVTSTTCNVKLIGYLNNVTVSSSNILITTAAQWVAGYYVVVPRYSANIATTTSPGPASVVIRATVEADDYLVGQVISRTEMIVFNSNTFNYDNVGSW